MDFVITNLATGEAYGVYGPSAGDLFQVFLLGLGAGMAILGAGWVFRIVRGGLRGGGEEI